MLPAFAAFFENHPKDAVWLVACSGGQDSAVLMELCREAGVSFAVAHVNYHLRGAASLADEQLVARLAGRARVACHFLSSPVTQKSGLQAHARKVRYDFFADLCRSYGYYGTLVAHHAQDQVETILHNLLRGTGLKGLAAMQGWDERRRIGRPLLEVDKDAIRHYAWHNHVEWHDDASNASDAYSRNRIRRHLLPILKQLRPDYQQSLLKTAHQAYEAWQSISPGAHRGSQVDSPAMYALADENEYAQAGKLQAAYPGLAFPLALRLAKAAADPVSADRKLETAQGVFEIRDRVLHFTPADGPAEGSRKTPPGAAPSITITPGVTAPATVEELRTEAARGVYYLSEAACPPPYTLRPAREGDRIQPLGLKGTKLISDLRQEKGLAPSAARDMRVLVREDGMILWVSLGVVGEGARVELGGGAVKIIAA